MQMLRAVFYLLSTLGFQLTGNTAERQACSNNLSDRRCMVRVRRGECVKNAKMVHLCRRSCGYCPQEQCEDKLSASHCGHLKGHMACSLNHQRMKILCPNTCGFCATTCENARQDCEYWKGQGHCENDPIAMRRDCAQTCKYCGPRTACDETKCAPGHKCRIDQYGLAACVCNIKCDKTKITGPVCASNGQTYRSMCAMFKDECQSKTMLTAKYFGMCHKEYTCKDADEVGGDMCGQWREAGGCENNRDVMQYYCPKTCQLCRQQTEGKSCEYTQFGCCWNKENEPSKGPFGMGCGVCKDIPGKMCEIFKSDCGGRNKRIMKKYCPETCRYCVSPDVLQRTVISNTAWRRYINNPS